MRLSLLEVCLGERGSVRIPVYLPVNSIYKEPRLDKDRALFTTYLLGPFITIDKCKGSVATGSIRMILAAKPKIT